MKRKDKVILTLACVVLSVIAIFRIYCAVFHPFVIIGTNNEFHSTSETELDLRFDRLRPNEQYKLTYFKDMKVLNLRGNVIKNFDFLDSLSLEELQIGFSPKNDPDIKGEALDDYYIGNYSDAEFGKMLGYDSIDYSSLFKQKQLKKFAVFNFWGNDITFLNNMPYLEDLEFSLHDFTVEELETIGKLTSLKALDLHHSYIPTLSPLTSLKNLKSLEIWKFDYEPDKKPADISALYTLSTVEELDITGLDSVDIRRLIEMDSLKRVEVSKEMYPKEDIDFLRDHGIDIEEK